MNDNQEFNIKIQELSDKYFLENKKNSIFKNFQKIECANMITDSIGIDNLIVNTFFIIKNTNSIFIDYTVFKRFIVPEYYSKVVNYITSLIKTCITNYGTFNMHINLDSFTVSAAERYKNIIIIFLNNSIGTDYSIKLNNLFIYNTPSAFQTISTLLSPLVEPTVKNKMVIYDKNDSTEILKILFRM
jgi:hypothetical protein|uniref:CRAL-TRIO domain-containing protein n=1 Tax=viral metagenome TaxID=1070528 RepID=A0A6C0JK34_9ZZZZ